jgi:hypothetical protein
MSLSAEILCRIVGIETDTADIATNTRVTKVDYFLSLSDGDGANQAQVIYSDARTSAGTDTFQLSSLPDTRDGASVTIAFTAAKVLWIENTHASHTLTVTGAYSGSVPPGGVLLATNPTAAGTTASSLFVASTVGATYKIVIVGEGSIV